MNDKNKREYKYIIKILMLRGQTQNHTGINIKQ